MPEVRYGLTVPFRGVALRDHRRWFEEAMHLGYTDLWSSESNGADAFTPLALAAAWTPSARLGTAIVPSFTRGPAVVAQTAAALADASGGGFCLGVGSSSDVIVERWNGMAHDRPLARTRDLVRFLRRALRGERVSEDFETFSVKGFELAQPPAQPPPVLVAALRPRMLRLAGEEADGVILNWLSADDVVKVVPYACASSGTKEVVARVMVCPTTDAAAVRGGARPLIASYTRVPVYRAYQSWLGRDERLSESWTAWDAGDREAAVAAVPDNVVDEFVVYGSPEECHRRLAEFRANGVTTLALAFMPWGVDVRSAMRAMAPSGRAPAPRQ